MKKKFGYARCSTNHQELEMQIVALENAGCEKIFQEKISGRKSNRPELAKMMEELRDGDEVVCYSLSRLGRSTKDLLTIFQMFEEHNINFISLKENIDLSTPTGKLIMTVLSAISEFEVETIRSRVKDGLDTARANGRIGGRPKVDQVALDRAKRMYQSKQHSLREIKELTGIPATTLYRYLDQN